VIFKYKPALEMRVYQEKTNSVEKSLVKSYLRAFTIFYFIAVILAVIYYKRVGMYWMADDPVLTRTVANRGNGLFFRSYLTFLPLSFFSYYLFYKQYIRKKAKYFFFLIAISCILSLVVVASRAALLWYAIPGIIIANYSMKSITFKKALLLFLVTILISVVIQFSYPLYSGLSAKDAVFTIIERSTKVQAIGIDYIAYQVVPAEGYQFGRFEWRDFQGLLNTLRLKGGEYRSAYADLFSDMAGGISQDTPYTLSTSTIGDLFADFGFIGTGLGLFIYGIIAQYLNIFVTRKKKSIFILIIYSFLQCILIQAHIAGGIFGILANYGISICIYILFISFIVGFLKK
jgi:oligosaccharide repeat unit polymerase